MVNSTINFGAPSEAWHISRGKAEGRDNRKEAWRPNSALTTAVIVS